MSNINSNAIVEMIVYVIAHILYSDTIISYNVSYIERRVKDGKRA